MRKEGSDIAKTNYESSDQCKNKLLNQRQWVVIFSALITTFIVSNVGIMKDNIVYIYISLVINF